MLTQRQTESISEQHRPISEAVRIERFIGALTQAMAVNGCSQRHLARIIGVESGTFTKYFQGRVDPLKVGTGIQRALAAALGVTLDSLVAFYQGGAYLSGVGIGEAATWIRSEAEKGDLLAILGALRSASERWEDLGVAPPVELTPFPWPTLVIERLGLAPDLLERMGVTPEALERLVRTGEFASELVDGFALATGLEAEAVRRAFSERRPT